MSKRNLLSGWTVLVRATALAALVAAPASAINYVGDLVYCDQDADGIYDPTAGDYGIDGVGVTITCAADGTACEPIEVVTGAPNLTDTALQFCGDALSFDPAGDLSGRYFAEITQACPSFAYPRVCTVEVDPTTLPADCNVLVTPVAGLPADANDDGDACDAGDGPFAEGQPLLAANGEVCDPLPEDGVFMASFFQVSQLCSVHNDFGFAPEIEEEEECVPCRKRHHDWKRFCRHKKHWIHWKHRHAADELHELPLCPREATHGRRDRWGWHHATTNVIVDGVEYCPVDMPRSRWEHRKRAKLDALLERLAKKHHARRHDLHDQLDESRERAKERVPRILESLRHRGEWMRLWRAWLLGH